MTDVDAIRLRRASSGNLCRAFPTAQWFAQVDASRQTVVVANRYTGESVRLIRVPDTEAHYSPCPGPSSIGRTFPSAVERRLDAATAHWSSPVYLATYANDDEGRRWFEAEASVMANYGYLPLSQSADGGHVHVGRLLMTGGLSILAGKAGTRSTGAIAVTCQKTLKPNSEAPAVPAASPSTDVIELLEKLGQLHEKGVLTDDEYAAKKADLLARL